MINGTTTDFLVGRGDFFYENREWGGHDSSTSGMFLLEYAKVTPEIQFNLELNFAVAEILGEPNLTVQEIQSLLGLILFYYVYRNEEHKFPCEWKIPKSAKKLILNHIERLHTSHFDVSTLQSLVRDIETRFKW